MKYTTVLVFWGIMSMIGFISMGFDKGRAKKHGQRVSEMTLMLIATVGGAAGSWAGMEIFRHKTKHKKFAIGVPVLFVLQMLGISFLYNLNRILH